MDRRAFFKFGISKSKEVAFDIAKIGLKMKFKRTMIRPPGALPEEQFLLACTRCGDCKSACPYEAIHLVESFTAGVVSQTPFIDPYYKACHYCEDMPCIKACTPKALKQTENVKLKIATARVNIKHCLVSQGQRCDYCFKSCPSGIRAISKNSNGTPTIDPDLCVGCGKCAYICVSQTGKAIELEPA